MISRRNFLRTSIGGLAGLLYTKEAKADCFPLALELTVTPETRSDFFGGNFYSTEKDYTFLGSTVEDLRNMIVEIMATPVAKAFYPARVGIEYQMTKTPFTNGGIPIIYTTIEDFLEREPEAKEVISESTLGITLREKGRIYLFPRLDFQIEFNRSLQNANWVMLTYAKYLGVILTHELGHFFTLEHNRSSILFNGKKNIMYPTFGLSIKETLEEAYDFSPNDKRILNEKICS